jgi:hypothetical protein
MSAVYVPAASELARGWALRTPTAGGEAEVVLVQIQIQWLNKGLLERNNSTPYCYMSITSIPSILLYEYH